MKNFLYAILFLSGFLAQSQNKDPLATEIVTADLTNFWIALEKAGPEVNAEAIDKFYLKPGSKGVNAFMKMRIQSADHLAKVIRSHQKYYHSIKANVDSLDGMRNQVIQALVKLKDYYPDAIFPQVYFVIGALSSGGTSTDKGLIIGAEMYGLTSQTPKDELSEWLKTVIKPVNQVPHIVAHELIHFQQKYNTNTLLKACIKEGSADFLAELISGKHINDHIHDFANPMERELWEEFKTKMDKKDYKGWLYGPSVKGRPNDLGYWMGYNITKAYFDKASDKKAAVREILNIKDFHKFLDDSGYASKFK